LCHKLTSSYFSISGEEGENIIIGEPGNDRVCGGSGNDILVGRHGADKNMGNGNDVLLQGDDTRPHYFPMEAEMC
jgi:Ca2+-binding RTX toxin-like protein